MSEESGEFSNIRAKLADNESLIELIDALESEQCWSIELQELCQLIEEALIKHDANSVLVKMLIVEAETEYYIFNETMRGLN